MLSVVFRRLRQIIQGRADEIRALAQIAVSRALERFTREMADEIRALAPRDTGDLRRSIRAHESAGEVRAIFYAFPANSFVSRRGGLGFIERAARRVRERWPAILRSEFRRVRLDPPRTIRVPTIRLGR